MRVLILLVLLLFVGCANNRALFDSTIYYQRASLIDRNSWILVPLKDTYPTIYDTVCAVEIWRVKDGYNILPCNINVKMMYSNEYKYLGPVEYE